MWYTEYFVVRSHCSHTFTMWASPSVCGLQSPSLLASWQTSELQSKVCFACSILLNGRTQSLSVFWEETVNLLWDTTRPRVFIPPTHPPKKARSLNLLITLNSSVYCLFKKETRGWPFENTIPRGSTGALRLPQKAVENHCGSSPSLPFLSVPFLIILLFIC